MYEACERFWEQLVRGVEGSLNQTGEWERWLLRRYPDGTPVEMDGNPMFDGRSRTANHAFRILQHPSISNDLEIVAWLEANGEGYSEIPSAELVVNLSLSEESAQVARTLLSKWMMPNTTIEEMQRFLDERFGPNS
jgi:hypothetical protein